MAPLSQLSRRSVTHSGELQIGAGSPNLHSSVIYSFRPIEPVFIHTDIDVICAVRYLRQYLLSRYGACS